MMKPLRSNVLLRPTEAPQSSSGLIITASPTNNAVVVAIGSEVKELKVGDTVRYDSGVKLDSYIMCREADIFCVIE